jgi:hypothetical protein
MITKILTAVWTAVLVSTSVSTGTPIHNVPYSQRDDWAHETPESVIVDPWADAVTLTGYATTYDAFTFAGSWYDDTSTWIYASTADCVDNPACFWFNGRKAKPWSSTLNNLYAALGPVLRKVIADQMPRWHTIPTHKLRITSLESGRSVEVWVADYCACTGYAVRNGKKVHPLVDLSPEAWKALGRVSNGSGGSMYADGRQWSSNWITVEYLP